MVRKLNIFVDGSWLFKACGRERALSNRLEYSDSVFRLDFKKLSDELLQYANKHDSDCTEFGERIFSTSIFSLPDDLDHWPEEHEDITKDDVERVRSTVAVRERFAQSALDAGFSDEAIFHPRLKGWMLEKLRIGRYQEKQVDATVVALLVRSAIENGNDYHAIITGDADILPAIKVAYPKYSSNVFLVTTHPDQLAAESRQTSFSLTEFDYAMEPYYLEQHADKLLEGENIYVCVHCNKVFSRPHAIPEAAKKRPCCNPCHQKRT